jgi:hypothetical protein
MAPRRGPHSPAADTVKATVEVVRRDIGDQTEAERHVLTDMTYDDETDASPSGSTRPARRPSGARFGSSTRSES